METKQDELLKMSLQFFAENPDGTGAGDGDGADGADGNPDGVDGTDGADGTDDLDGTGEGSELSKEQQALLDRETSKRVENALKRQKEKFDSERKEIERKAKADAEAYAKMTESEKQESEYEKRIKEIEERENKLNNEQLLVEIKSDLNDNSLPQVFAESLLAIQDNEKIKGAIKELKDSWDKEINEAIKGKARQKTPKSSTFRGGGKTESKAEMARKNRIIK